MNHWQDPAKLTPHGDAWAIADGCLKTRPHPTITEDLVSSERFRDFEFSWEWRIAPGGNSGIKYRIQKFVMLDSRHRLPGKPKFEAEVQNGFDHHDFDRSSIPPGEKAQIYVGGFEYQMIDNARHADARRGPLYQTGALYSILPPAEDASQPVGEFNHSRLIVKGNHFEHWLNGKKVLDTDVSPEMLRHALGKRWGEASDTIRLLSEQPEKDCPISLQNHGDEAWFRDLKIRPLSAKQ